MDHRDKDREGAENGDVTKESSEKSEEEDELNAPSEFSPKKSDEEAEVAEEDLSDEDPNGEGIEDEDQGDDATGEETPSDAKLEPEDEGEEETAVKVQKEPLSMGGFYGLAITILILGLAFWVPSLLESFSLFPSANADKELEILAVPTLERVAVPNQQQVEGTFDELFDQVWKIRGFVWFKGKKVADADIFTEISDIYGTQHFADTKTNSEGKFTLSFSQGVMSEFDRPTIIKVKISAVYEKEGLFGQGLPLVDWFRPDIYRNFVVHKPESSNAISSAISEVDAPLGAALMIFILSILVGLFPTKKLEWLRAKHYAAALLSVVFTCTMIFFITFTISRLSDTDGESSVVPLGFATVYFDSYVEGGEASWLFSLSPRSQDSTRARGFGAPLWVLLVSVIGAAIFTIKLIVDNLKSDPEATDHVEWRKQTSAMIKHQFYIVFAPLGAIFVYQLLVLTKSASEPVLVGFAALASGIALNNILSRAWDTASSVIDAAQRDVLDKDKEEPPAQS